MTKLRDLLHKYVDDGSVPGAVAMVARGDQVEVQAAGTVDVEGTAPMARDSIFRIASTTKPIVAAAVMMLVEDGKLALDEPIGKWLPELASPMVVRTPDAPIDDVVPAARPITVFDLLTFRAGHGFSADFSLPVIEVIMQELQRDGREPQNFPSPDEWMAALSKIPLVCQPGEAWLYNTCSDIQGVLIARVSGQSLPDFLAERLFEPLGMVDSGFVVPEAKRDRFTTYYRPTPEGLEVADPPTGQWSTTPRFHSGAGGLVGTVDDWNAFAQMLIGAGAYKGRQLLSPESVRQMTTDYLTPAQRDASTLFLEGQGWGFGGSVGADGRYGWVGGTGTAAHVTASTKTVTILFTQVGMTSPQTTPFMRDFWAAS
jgi:CubicO group peptidase (beta-lactamase class C family)